ncbi:DUF6417 family protein [Streptomyces mirabilis]|uniref:DUF6417 family protein n=1 Tax=Streptomyces mirabilis TaxID=68239 RepID=UPI0036A0838D
MDSYEHLDLDEIDFAAMEHNVERLRLLTLDETYELIRVLRTVAEEGGAPGAGDRCAHPVGEPTLLLAAVVRVVRCPGNGQRGRFDHVRLAARLRAQNALFLPVEDGSCPQFLIWEVVGSCSSTDRQR